VGDNGQASPPFLPGVSAGESPAKATSPPQGPPLLRLTRHAGVSIVRGSSLFGSLHPSRYKRNRSVFPQAARPRREVPEQPLVAFRPSSEFPGFHEPHRSDRNVPKDEQHSAMAPLVGSRVPTALTDQRTISRDFHISTQPHPRGLITSSARYGPPNLPAILQTGTLMGLNPSELLPPSGAALGSPSRYLHAVPRNVHLRRFRRAPQPQGFAPR
jgi:hypothetical protein